jgi:hypothetical protein
VSGAAARQLPATWSSAVSRGIPSSSGGARRRDPLVVRRRTAAGEQRFAAQEVDPRVVAWVASRRGTQRLAGQLEARLLDRGGGLLERRPRAVVGDRGAEAVELVAREPVVAGSRVEPARRQLGVQASAHLRAAVDDAVRPRLVRRLVGREPQVALLPEDARLAAEGLAQLVEHGLEAAAHLLLVQVARRREVRARVVALEAGEPLEHGGPEAVEGAVHGR